MSSKYAGRVLSKDAIFGAADGDRREFVPCPEWGHVRAAADAPEFHDDAKRKPAKDEQGFALNAENGKRLPLGVFVRALTVKERGLARQLASRQVKDGDSGLQRTETDMEKMETLMVVQCAVDEDGRTIFKMTDWESLMDRSGGPINRIARKAMVLAGMLAGEDDLGN